MFNRSLNSSIPPFLGIPPPLSPSTGLHHHPCPRGGEENILNGPLPRHDGEGRNNNNNNRNLDFSPSSRQQPHAPTRRAFRKHRLFLTYANQSLENEYVRYYLRERKAGPIFAFASIVGGLMQICAVVVINASPSITSWILLVAFLLIAAVLLIVVLSLAREAKLLEEQVGRYSVDVPIIMIEHSDHRAKLQSNAARYERALTAVYVNASLGLLATYAARLECYLGDPSSYAFRDICENSMQTEAASIGVLLIIASTCTPRIAIFASVMLAHFLVLFPTRFIPVFLEVRTDFFCASTCIQICFCVIAAWQAWEKERQLRQRFEMHQEQQLHSMELNAIRQRRVRAASFVAPIEALVGVEKDSDGVWGWSTDSVVCMFQLQQFVEWSSLRSPIDALEAVRRVTECIDVAKSRYAPLASRYQSMGDCYVLMMNSGEMGSGALGRRRHPNRRAAIEGAKQLWGCAVESVARSVIVLSGSARRWHEENVLLMHNGLVEGKSATTTTTMRLRAALSHGACGCVLAPLRSSLVLIGPAFDDAQCLLGLKMAYNPVAPSHEGDVLTSAFFTDSVLPSFPTRNSFSQEVYCPHCNEAARLRVMSVRNLSIRSHSLPHASCPADGTKQDKSLGTSSAFGFDSFHSSFDHPGESGALPCTTTVITEGEAQSLSPPVSPKTDSTKCPPRIVVSAAVAAAAGAPRSLSTTFHNTTVTVVVDEEQDESTTHDDADDGAAEEHDVVTAAQEHSNAHSKGEEENENDAEDALGTVGCFLRQFRDPKVQEQFLLFQHRPSQEYFLRVCAFCTLLGSILSVVITAIYNVWDYVLIPVVASILLSCSFVAVACMFGNSAPKLVYTLLTFSHALAFAAPLFCAPREGNVFGNSRVPWGPFLVLFLTNHPMWSHALYEWIASLVLFSAYCLYSLSDPTYPTCYVRIFNFTTHTLGLLLMPVYYAWSQYVDRQGFIAAAKLEILRQETCENYSQLETVIGHLMPPSVAAELVQRYRHRHEDDDPSKRRTLLAPSADNDDAHTIQGGGGLQQLHPDHNTDFSTNTRETVFGIIELQCRKDVATDSRARLQHLLCAQKLIEQCITGSPLEVVKATLTCVVLTARRIHCESEVQSYQLCCLANRVCRMLHSALPRHGDGTFIVEHRMVLHSGPLVGAIVGRNSAAFDLYGGSLCKAKALIRNIQWGSCLATSRIVRSCLTHCCLDPDLQVSAFTLRGAPSTAMGLLATYDLLHFSASVNFAVPFSISGSFLQVVLPAVLTVNRIS